MDTLANSVANIIGSGRRLFLDLFPNMNCKPFVFAVSIDSSIAIPNNTASISPSTYLSVYRRYYNAIVSRIGPSNRDKISFLWRPSCSVDRLGKDKVSPSSPGFNDLDRNGDAVVDDKDDPFTPYYPGSSVVDWIGCSTIYYNPLPPPLRNNTALPEDYFLGVLKGVVKNVNGSSVSTWPIYETMSGFNKPFLWGAIGAGWLFDLDGKTLKRPQDLTRLEFKNAFWNQTLNLNRLRREFPNIRAISLLEESVLVAADEGIHLDFGNTGCWGGNTSFCGRAGGNETVGDFVRFLKSQSGFAFARDKPGGGGGETETPVVPVVPVSEETGNSSVKADIIAGTVISVAVVGIMVAAVFVWRRRKRSQGSVEVLEKVLVKSESMKKDDVFIGRTQTVESASVASASGVLENLPDVSVSSGTSLRGSSESIKREGSGLFPEEVPDDQKPSGLFNPMALNPHEATREFLVDPEVKRDIIVQEEGGVACEKTEPFATDVLAIANEAANAREQEQTTTNLGDVATWDTRKVKQWVLESGLGDHLAEVLENNEVNGYNLLLLSDRKLQDMGIHLATARNLILFVVSQLRQDGGPSGSSSALTLADPSPDLGVDLPPGYSN
ncbi:hypothetical protein HDU97_004782 [Phlyctochytrium planicorne]|nr:hypothetical protein HDU97_004782 [Phlyctochytrium planicorne]